MKIQARLLIQTLSASLALILVLGTVFFVSVAGIRNTVLANSNVLGDNAADISAYALEVQLTEKVDRIAQNIALILDERLSKIENHTKMTADIAGAIYSARQSWRPKTLPRIMAGDIPPPEPYLYIVPGVDFSSIRTEVELAGNIGDMLRQITVVDRGMTTSALGGESGYVITMDTYPWPFADYDRRQFIGYRRAVAEGLYWADVYEDHRGRGAAISCSVPYYDESGGGRVLKGVARSTVLLSDFAQMIDSAGVVKSGQLFILNRAGIMIYSSEGAEIETEGEGEGVRGVNFLESPNRRICSLGMSMTLGASGMTELEMDGLPVYVAYAPIQTLGWSLGIAVSVHEVAASALLIENQIWRMTEGTMADMNRSIFLLAGFVALIMIATLLGIGIFSVRFTQSITGPILMLNDGVHEVAGGNLEREVTVKTDDELEQLAASFNMMTAQLRRHIEEIARATAERQRIDTEIDIAMQIQMSMLPKDFPPFRGLKNDFDLYAEVHPAKIVGGDFYDFFFIDNDHFAVIVADVSGKGIPASLFMAITKTIIKNRLQSGEDPALALEIINHQLCDNNIMDMFVTVWLCILEIPTSRLLYINAGHNPPLVKHGDQDFTFLVSPPDLVLAGMDDTRYHSREIQLEEGDMLFLYTDGIVEAADADYRFYGKDRMKAFLAANAGLPFREMLPGLRADIAAFTCGAEQSDDITMLALRIYRHGEAEQLRSITLKAEVANLKTLTGFLDREFDAVGCPQKVRGQVELAAEEIFINIANYAYTEKPGEVIVDCRFHPSPGGMGMTLIFSDRGIAFNPLEHEEPDVTLSLEEREVGGLGLLIVRKTMDTMQYSRENGVNRLEFTKSWQKEEQ